MKAPRAILLEVLDPEFFRGASLVIGNGAKMVFDSNNYVSPTRRAQRGVGLAGTPSKGKEGVPMFSSAKSIVPCVFIAIASTSICHGDGLSPSNWSKAARESVEKLESLTVSPLEMRRIEGTGGLVSATVSPIAVHAGIKALKLGGSAADAAAATALTQIATQLGSVVSYAGVFTMVYYDAKAGKVYSMDAGFNSYLNETDPKSIPVSDLGPELAKFAPKPTEGGARGRETLVPGFMAGVEAMHKRFGRLPFRDLFEPAIWYAEHGIRISRSLQYYFTFRGKALSRTLEGRQFSRQECGETPKAGDLFLQLELAKTLKAVGEQGSRYMYTGQWGQDFVRIIQREGGKVTEEDMKRYKPIWSEPYKETIFGRTVYVNGPPHLGAYALFVGLNLAEALKLDRKGPYWSDAEAFQAITRISQIAASSPALGKETSSVLRGKGVDISPGAQLGKVYARAVVPVLGQIFAPRSGSSDPKHSNAIVAIDREGNIAAVTHTINAVIWGDTGIVVDGVPIPDSAGFQQTTLAALKPGERVPHQIIDTIAFDGDKPVLATGSIGVSLIPESIRVLLGVLGRHEDFATVMVAPPLLAEIGSRNVAPTGPRERASIPHGRYGAEFIAKLNARGANVTELPGATAAALRGTLAAVAIDPKSGKRIAVNQPGVMVFNDAE
jgi:gamma-glutamyltranspeptidase / glutathione hydrolase